MVLTTISSGSKGNCYLLTENNHTIILDCGLPINKITSNPNYPSFKNIDFVFVSHCPSPRP